MQNGTAALEDNLAVSYKTKHILIMPSSNHAPWYSPKEAETFCSHKNVHMDVYIVALFIIAKNWKQLGCPSGEWMDELWFIQTTEY